MCGVGSRPEPMPDKLFCSAFVVWYAERTKDEQKKIANFGDVGVMVCCACYDD